MFEEEHDLTPAAIAQWWDDFDRAVFPAVLVLYPHQPTTRYFPRFGTLP